MLDVASRVERRPISSAPFVRSESGPRLGATLREVRAKILPLEHKNLIRPALASL